MRPAPRRLDVFLVRVRLGYSADCRPCIIVEPPQHEAAVVLVSASDLFNAALDFRLDASCPEFKGTGLKKTSYALGRAFVAVPVSALGKRLGRIEGNLASRFEAWLAQLEEEK